MLISILDFEYYFIHTFAFKMKQQLHYSQGTFQNKSLSYCNTQRLQCRLIDSTKQTRIVTKYMYADFHSRLQIPLCTHFCLQNGPTCMLISILDWKYYLVHTIVFKMDQQLYQSQGTFQNKSILHCNTQGLQYSLLESTKQTQVGIK